ncbi:MAG: hypothetical protein IJ131_05000 [Eggerthellaceae bacterium]|nr:hypothetical protein [Eggerthellaceae bacterium]MBQ9068411.1 hypothetical protein [Eggerthellaceae bacterium]
MGDVDRARLKVALSRHYATQRESVSLEEIDALAAAMVAEDARARMTKGTELGHAAFVADQVRYIPAWTWAAQVAIVAIMCFLAHTAGNAAASKLAIGLLSALSVLVGVPTMQASKLHNVAELEYSCPHNAASVMVARLIVLGCSSALAVGIMIAVAASALDVSAFDVALWACPPFFLSCAGSLMALRLAPAPVATMLCAVWTVACSAALLALASTVPQLYAHASLASWATAAALACTWLVREIAMTVRTVDAGLDAFSPHMAKTYN